MREGDAVILRPKADAAGRWTSLPAAVNRGFSPTSWRTAGSSRTNSVVSIATECFNDPHRLLDTNAVIALVRRRRSEALLHRVEFTETGSLTVSSVLDHELHCGVASGFT